MRSSECVIARLIVLGAALGVLFVCSATGQQNETTKEPFEKILVRAEKGDAVAQFNVGYAYQTGEGVSASRWYKIAADRGEEKGAANLGRCYRDGRGVPQDDREAVRLLRIVADAGDAAAQSDLGVAYGRGRAVARSNVEAPKWFARVERSSALCLRSPYMLGLTPRELTYLLQRIPLPTKAK